MVSRSCNAERIGNRGPSIASTALRAICSIHSSVGCQTGRTKSDVGVQFPPICPVRVTSPQSHRRANCSSSAEIEASFFRSPDILSSVCPSVRIVSCPSTWRRILPSSGERALAVSIDRLPTVGYADRRGWPGGQWNAAGDGPSRGFERDRCSFRCVPVSDPLARRSAKAPSSLR